MEEFNSRKLVTKRELDLALKTILTRYRNNALVSINTAINRLEEERDIYDWDQESDDELQTFYKEKNDLDQLTPNFLRYSFFRKKNKIMFSLYKYLIHKFNYGNYDWHEKSTIHPYASIFENKAILQIFDFFEVQAFDSDGKKFLFYKLVLIDKDEKFISFRKIEKKKKEKFR